MQCEVCGSEKNLVKAIVEGTELVVCGNCARFGKVLGPFKTELKAEKRQATKAEAPEEEILEIVAANFSEIIKKKREMLGLKQEDFAKKINEKVSVVHKMETGEFKPTIDMARKLERLLGVKLVEEYKDQHDKKTAGAGDAITLGDVVKIKRR